MVNKMIGLYEPDTPHWSSIEELNEAFNWTGHVSQTGAELLQSHGVSQKFTYEIIESLSRCNYAQVRQTASLLWLLNLIISIPQNVDRMHGLETLVSFAGDGSGVRSIKGGNWRIFEQFVERSGARVFLNTEVDWLFFSHESMGINVGPGGWHRAALEGHLDSCHQG